MFNLTTGPNFGVHFILKYETALKTGRFVVVGHGGADEMKRARDIVRSTNPEAMDEHIPVVVTPEEIASLK